FKEMKSARGTNDDLAKAIAFTPAFEVRAKYRKLNAMLILLLLYYGLIRTAMAVNILYHSHPKLIPAILIGPYFVLALAVAPVMAFGLAREVYRFRGYAYFTVLACGFLALNDVSSIEKGLTLEAVLLYYAPILSAMILAAYLPGKLRLPSLFGPNRIGEQKDANGDYIFR
ncbi:MAG: hypothetical protein HZC51_14335, partial [Nitrospirae bacterium]|nr:hypothetical protein [Nitrospirota bacterium]